MKKLTKKQTDFVNLYIELGNAAEAYRRAYDVGKDTTEQVVYNEASKLLRNRYISVRVSELKSELGEQYKIEQGYIIQGLLEIINDTEETFDLGKLSSLDKDERSKYFRMMQQTKNTDKLRALETLAKMLGLNEPEKHEHTVDIKPFKTKWGK